MIAYMKRNCDITVFFEEEDILGLEKGRIKGNYVNVVHSGISNMENICEMEAEVVPDLNDMVVTDGRKSENFFEWYEVKIKGNIFKELCSDGTSGTPQGFRHVELWDVGKLPFGTEYYMLKNFVDSQLEG